MGNTLFPAVPEDLAALGDEELSDLLASFQSVSRQLRAGEADLSEHYPDLTEAERSAAVMDDWREAATVVQSIRAEQEARVSAQAEFDAQAAELDAQFGEGEALAVATEADENEEDENEEEESDSSEALSDESETVEAEAESVTDTRLQ